MPDESHNRELAQDTSPSCPDRQEDLKDAFARDDDIGVLELISNMAQGAERLIQLTRQPGTTDDELVRSPWPGEIRSAKSWFLSVDAKCGLRGGSQPRSCQQAPPGAEIAHYLGHGATRNQMKRVACDCKLDAQSIDTHDHHVAQSSPFGEVIRALEEDLCSHPRASRRVPQSPGGTPASIQDRQDLASEGFPELAPLPVDGTIVDSTEDKPSVQRVSSVLAGSLGSILWDSQTSNEIVGPTRVSGSCHIGRRNHRRLSLESPDLVPVQNEGDAEAPFVEANREVVPERVGGVVVEALEDVGPRERKCQLIPAAEFLSGTDFWFLSRQWETPNVSCPQWWMDQVGMRKCSP